MGDSAAAAGERAQGAGGVHPASWGSQRGGGRAGGRLKPDVKVTIGGDRPPRLGGDVVTFEDMREFLVAYLEYEQQMNVANQDGGNRVLARRRELLDSVTSRARPGKATRATATPPSSSNSSSNPQAVPFRIPGVDTPRPSLRLPPLPLELAGTRPIQKRW